MSLKRLLIFAVIGLALFTACAKRSTGPTDSSVLSLFKEIPVVGNAVEIDGTDTELYVAADQGGLTVINTNTWQSRWWTKLFPGGSGCNLINIRRVSVVPEHDLLFIGEYDAADNVYIVDVSDPDYLLMYDNIQGGTDKLQQIRFNAINNPTGNDIIQGYYVSTKAVSGSISRPTLTCWRYTGLVGDARPIWQIGTTYQIHGFDVTDNLVVLTQQQRGLFIYERRTQNKLSEIALTGQALDVKVSGDYAYVACRQEGLQIVDISDPADPKFVSRFDTKGYATSVDLKDNLALVSSGSGGVYLFDVSNPAKPILKENITSAGYSNKAIFYKYKVVVAARDKGVVVYKFK